MFVLCLESLDTNRSFFWLQFSMTITAKLRKSSEVYPWSTYPLLYFVKNWIHRLWRFLADFRTSMWWCDSAFYSLVLLFRVFPFLGAFLRFFFSYLSSTYFATVKVSPDLRFCVLPSFEHVLLLSYFLPFSFCLSWCFSRTATSLDFFAFHQIENTSPLVPYTRTCSWISQDCFFLSRVFTIAIFYCRVCSGSFWS